MNRIKSILKHSPNNIEFVEGKKIEKREGTKFIAELSAGAKPLEFLDQHHLTDGDRIIDINFYKRKP